MGLKKFLGAAALFLGLAAATELVLYPDFAEIREPVRLEHGVYVWQPGERVASKVIDDLVWLDGVAVQRQVWRKGSLWFYAEGEAATLHHLSRGLSGRMRYRLAIDRGFLEGWLVVQNDFGEPLRVDSLTYLSGSVPLGSRLQREPVARTLGLAKAPSPAKPEVSTPGGLFRYALDGPVRLEPERTDLRIFEARAKPQFFWRYRGPFVESGRLALTRGYRFRAERPLAAGTLDLFKNGLFLGRLSVPDRYQGEDVELPLGPAQRAKTKRRIDVLVSRPNQKRYRVETRVENPGDEPVYVEIEERFSAEAVKVEIASGEVLPRGYRVSFLLPPGASRSYVYTVTLEWRR